MIEIKHSALISEYVHVKVTVAALLTTDIGINGLLICTFIHMYLQYYFCLIFQWFFNFPLKSALHGMSVFAGFNESDKRQSSTTFPCLP